jgi:hypothetical protein
MLAYREVLDMRAFARTSPSAADPAMLNRTRGEQGRAIHPARPAQRGIENQAATSPGYDFSRISIHAPRTVNKDKVGGRAGSGGGDDDAVALDAGSGSGSGSAQARPLAPAPAPAAPAHAKTAGVDSFVVKWSKNTVPGGGEGPANPRLRLEFIAKFRKDADHDPALAEFRQNAMTVWEITDGTHKGQKVTETMHDDNYSRADADAGTIADVDFTSNDNPGVKDINADDVLDYSFTAEQMIIDTSQANKVIAKRGPHTATIRGKNPRTYGGVPVTINS